jgi:hypothetical protein
MLLRVTPPATITPIPVLPSVTSTITQSPITPTSTQELTTALPSVIVTADVEAQPSLSGMGALLVVVLVVAGLLVLGWAARRK